MNRSALLLSTRQFLNLSHLKSRRYHFVFFTLTCPPVAWYAPEDIWNPSWDVFIVFFCGGIVRWRYLDNGGLVNKVVSYQIQQFL